MFCWSNGKNGPRWDMVDVENVKTDEFALFECLVMVKAMCGVDGYCMGQIVGFCGFYLGLDVHGVTMDMHETYAKADWVKMKKNVFFAIHKREEKSYGSLFLRIAYVCFLHNALMNHV